MSFQNEINWTCGCMVMKEFNYRTNGERTVGRSYCRKQDCIRKESYAKV